MKPKPALRVAAATTLLLTALLAVLPERPARAQQDELYPSLPAGDADLVDVKTAAVSAVVLASRKEFLSEPQYDPAKAEAAEEAMADVLVALEVLRPWTREALRAESKARVERIEQVMETGGRLAEVQEIIFWQKLFQDVGEFAWDAIGIVEAAKRVRALRAGAWSDEAFKAAGRTPGLRARDLDLGTAWSMMNEAAATANTLASRVNTAAQDLGGGGSAVAADLLEAHGRLVEAADLLQKLHEARQTGQSLTTRANLAAVLNPVFQILRKCAAAAQKELQAREAELEAVLSAEERQLTKGHAQRVRIGERHDLHLEATAALEAAWTDLWRAFELGASPGATMPGDAPASWGAAFKQHLPELRRRIDVMTEALDELEVVPGDEARIALAQRTVAPGAELVVTYDLPSGAARRAWLGLHRAADPHGSEGENARTKLDLRSIPRPQPGQRARGEVAFTAPEETGSYDVRLNDAGAGLELRSLSFAVRSPAEGLRLEFAPGMTGVPDGPDGVTLPAVVAGEHSEHLIEVRVVDADDRPVGGVPVEVRVLDEAGEETLEGPRVRGRWGLMSDEDGVVRCDHLLPLVFAVPEGRWTIELHSPEVGNRARVRCSAVVAPAGGVAIAAGADPGVVNSGFAADARRTVTISGSLAGGARGVRYRLQAKLDPALGRILPAGEAEDGWVDVRTAGGMQAFRLLAVVKQDLGRDGVSVALRALDPETAAVAGETTVAVAVRNIPEGFGLVDVAMRDPLGNPVWKPWRLHWKQDGAPRALDGTNYFGHPQLVPVGTCEVSYGCFYAVGRGAERYEEWVRGVEVIEGEQVVVEVRDDTAIIEVRTFDASGQVHAGGQVELFRAGSEEPADRHIRRFATRRRTNTPTGFVEAYTHYVEVLPGSYDVRFETARVAGEYTVTEWYSVTVGPREWRTLGLQDR